MFAAMYKISVMNGTTRTSTMIEGSNMMWGSELKLSRGLHMWFVVSPRFALCHGKSPEYLGLAAMHLL